MDARHAVLLAVQEEESGELVGRTLLQKKLYFASRLVGSDIAFRPHYYGPYSQAVADATDTDVNNRYLEEQVEVFPESNTFGERRRHSFTITDDGRALLKSMEDDPEIVQWRSALRKINNYQLANNYDLLSIAAKIQTILSDIKKGTAQVISAKAREYGWELTSQQIEEVADFLIALGLTEEHRKAPQG